MLDIEEKILNLFNEFITVFNCKPDKLIMNKKDYNKLTYKFKGYGYNDYKTISTYMGIKIELISNYITMQCIGYNDLVVVKESNSGEYRRQRLNAEYTLYNPLKINTWSI